MKIHDRSYQISPEQYERRVRSWLESATGAFDEFSSTHREVLRGSDCEYEIDDIVRFRAHQTPFLVLVECKRYGRAIERDVIQVLNDRVRSIGAKKGILFSASKFQSGALTCGEKYGIALMWLFDGSALIMGRSGDPLLSKLLLPDRPDFIGISHSWSPQARQTCSPSILTTSLLSKMHWLLLMRPNPSSGGSARFLRKSVEFELWASVSPEYPLLSHRRHCRPLIRRLNAAGSTNRSDPCKASPNAMQLRNGAFTAIECGMSLPSQSVRLKEVLPWRQ
jgi:restriction system protein